MATARLSSNSSTEIARAKSFAVVRQISALTPSLAGFRVLPMFGPVSALSLGFLFDTLLVVAAFIPIIYYDLRYRRIPDVYVLSCAGAIAARRLIFEFPSSIWFLLCGLLGFGFIFLFWLFTRKIGMGDAKLSGLIALWLGLTGWLVALLAASLAGIVYAAIRIRAGTMPAAARIPFAPFLGLGAAAGFTFCAFFGRIFDVYLWGGV